MKLFDVYSLFDVEPVSAKGARVYTSNGTEYLDFYGGHAVISIGHSHPYYVEKMKAQVEKMIFYSNSVQNGLQTSLAEKLGRISECDDHDLFLCNSGAEAVENALKLASFRTGRTKVLAIQNGFHGRTSAAVNVTDNDKIKAPINTRVETVMIPMNDMDSLKENLQSKEFAAVIIECIQGVGGLDTAEVEFLQVIEKTCKETGTAFIADEIQCGFGRSGKFFAFQYADVTPDIITIAKGMGNGFPIAGVLIQKNFIEAWPGMLGTTFGGNHLACTACNAVLDVIENENLISNAAGLGDYLSEKLTAFPEVTEVKGKGLMLGAKFDFPIKELRANLVYEQNLFTGSAKDPNLLRILPPLNITKEDADDFLERLKTGLSNINKEKPQSR